MKPFRFGIVGEYQSGKSLLINCILHRSIATIGVGVATTHTIVNYIYAEKEHVVFRTDDGVSNSLSIDSLKQLDTRTDIAEIDVYLTNDKLKHFILTDMPGFGANENDNIAARRTLRDIDFAILIAWNNKVMGAKSQSYNEIRVFKALNIPYYFFLNCTNTDRWRCDDDENIDLAQRDLSLLDFHRPSCYPVSASGVNIINLMWFWYSICSNDDELICRKKNISAFKEYDINNLVKQEVGKASNFELINKLFDMDNLTYLELRREIKDEITRLKNEICPIGTIQAFAYNSIPYGWMLCDGHSELIAEYPELYKLIGNTYGGDGTTSFCVPDLRGRFIRGYDNTGKIDEKRKFGSKQEDSFQSHLHNFDVSMVKLSKDGRHYHPLWCNEYDTVYDISGLASSDKGKRMCYPSNEEGSGKTDLGPYAGEHSHEFTLSGSPISSPKQDGSTLLKSGKETRPKNIALLYCIKCR